jgi:hypothetical protein
MVYQPARGSFADFVPPPPIESDSDIDADSSDEPFRRPRLKWDGAELIAIDRGHIREPLTFPDPSLGRLGDWTPPSLHLDWDPVEELIAERNRHR